MGALSLCGVLVAACGDDGGAATGGAGECGAGTVLCGDTCTAIEVDPNHCGACGSACGDGEACDRGVCVLECGGGTAMCGGSCVDTQSNPAHCGGCDAACDAQEVCSAGQCASVCGAGLARCGDACVDTSSDALNCGGCGDPCGAAEACVDGGCVAQQAPRAVYTLSNDASGNAILAFERAPDGSLSPSGSLTLTGGRGAGAGLGSQGALVFDEAQSLFFAANAGDHTVSMLALTPSGAIELLSNVPSGGERPISVTVSGGVVYVVNAGVAANGTEPNISGFRIMDGSLVPIPNSTRPLSAPNANPAQIQFSPDGAVLVVTEKGTNTISTYTVTADLADGPLAQASEGQTPFGFDFSEGGQLIVSEAAAGQPGLSSASSYAVGADGALAAVTGALPTTRTAACWLVVAGGYAYMANAGTDDITGFQVGADGALTMLDADGVTGLAGDAPTDEDVTEENDFLYVLNGGSDSFSIFQINADGSLAKLPDFVGLPASSVGLVAR